MKVTCTNPHIVFMSYVCFEGRRFEATRHDGARLSMIHRGDKWEEAYFNFIDSVTTFWRES